MTFPLYRAELPASLTAAESAELAAGVTSLYESGLPLESGLFALADEIARPRLSDALRNLAARLQRGEKLETAIAAQGSRLPAYLRGLIVAGLRSRRLPVVLDQFAAFAQRQQDLRGRVLLTFAYPALLLGVMAAIAVYCDLFVSVQFAKIFKDFGTKLPDITIFLIDYLGLIAWSMVGLTVAVLIVPLAVTVLPLTGRLGRAASWIPVVGTIIRDDRHAQFAALMAVLLEAEIPLPEALLLTSIALQHTVLGEQCRTAGKIVEEGGPLSQALSEAGFPASMTALVAWGQQKNSLADSFRAAVEVFEARTNSQNALLSMIALPLMFMAITTFVGFVVIGFFMPLIALISNLSGGK